MIFETTCEVRPVFWGKGLGTLWGGWTTEFIRITIIICLSTYHGCLRLLTAAMRWAREYRSVPVPIEEETGE